MRYSDDFPDTAESVSVHGKIHGTSVDDMGSTEHMDWERMSLTDLQQECTRRHFAVEHPSKLEYLVPLVQQLHWFEALSPDCLRDVCCSRGITAPVDATSGH